MVLAGGRFPANIPGTLVNEGSCSGDFRERSFRHWPMSAKLWQERQETAYRKERLILSDSSVVDADVQTWSGWIKGVCQRNKVVSDILLVCQLSICVQVDKQMLSKDS